MSNEKNLGWLGYLLGQWLNFKLFWDSTFSRENKVQTFFFQGPLAEWGYKGDEKKEGFLIVDVINIQLSSNQNPGYLLYRGDETLPSYIGIIS